jgi:AraC family transcriptional regulator of adaptative response / DNA-3-methyladenine glycosylase II
VAPVEPAWRGVRTTGIYCAPQGCAGNPLPHNVTPYGLAAAAEAAGFRACHRCRPYRRSEPVAWLDGPELVCRAVRLVVDGALDGSDEAGLAAALGVSARHLRRLFVEHVGATPDQVARSRRAHFARRLLDDTDLTVTEVAFAAGFGSVRQFNRAMHEIFRAAPTALRARRRRADRLVADGGLALRLPYRPPFDWPALSGFLKARAIPGVEVVDGDIYRRTVLIDGQPGVLEVQPGDDDHLVVTAHLPYWDGLIHVVQRARRLFDLDADPVPIVKALSTDPGLADRVRARPGVRVPGAWDPFECGVRAIVGQQVSVAGATTLMGRIVERYGQAVPGLSAMGLHRAFPAVEVLAAADLGGLGMPGARAATVRAFAAAVAASEVRLDGTMHLAGLVDSLTAVKGIGAWTAHYLALRLGERDAFPAGDLGLRRALAVGDADLPAPAAVAARAESWQPWRAYAAVHLWNDVWPRPQASTHDGGAHSATKAGPSSDHELSLSR